MRYLHQQCQGLHLNLFPRETGCFPRRISSHLEIAIDSPRRVRENSQEQLDLFWGLLGDRTAFIYLLALGCVRESVISYLQNFVQTPNHRHKTSVCLQTSAINSSKDFSLATKFFGFFSCSLSAAKLPGWQQADKAPSACLCHCWGEDRLHICLLMGFLWSEGPHKAGSTQSAVLRMQQGMKWCTFTCA